MNAQLDYGCCGPSIHFLFWERIWFSNDLQCGKEGLGIQGSLIVLNYLL